MGFAGGIQFPAYDPSAPLCRIAPAAPSSTPFLCFPSGTVACLSRQQEARMALTLSSAHGWVLLVLAAAILEIVRPAAPWPCLGLAVARHQMPHRASCLLSGGSGARRSSPSF